MDSSAITSNLTRTPPFSSRGVVATGANAQELPNHKIAFKEETPINYIMKTKQTLKDVLAKAKHNNWKITHFQTEAVDPDTNQKATIGYVTRSNKSNLDNAKFFAAFLKNNKKGKFNLSKDMIEQSSIDGIEITGYSYTTDDTNQSPAKSDNSVEAAGCCSADNENRTDRGENGYVPQRGWVMFDDGINVNNEPWRKTYVGFEWTSSGLSTLNRDDNETIEVQVSFYNYRDVAGTDADESWMNIDRYMTSGDTYPGYSQYEGYLYATNMPNSYPDTKVDDPDDNNDGYLDEMNFDVGCYDTNALEANRLYYWKILGPSGGNSTGWFKVEAQRGYIGTTFWDDMALNVYSEPNESASDYRISPFSARQYGIVAGDGKRYTWYSTGGLQSIN